MTKIKDKILKVTRKKQKITYKGTPIKISADFSREILQVRRELHDIFKVMICKNLQPRILYLVRLSFRFNREIKSFTENLRRIQHHQTSFTTNAKGTSLGRKNKRGKRPIKINPKLFRKWK